MDNYRNLIIGMVFSSIQEYQTRKKQRIIAIKEGRKRMATTCLMYMRREIDWLKHSGYPEILGYNGEVVARRIEKINVPEDYIGEERQLAEIMEGENETDL